MYVYPSPDLAEFLVVCFGTRSVFGSLFSVSQGFWWLMLGLAEFLVAYFGYHIQKIILF